MLTIPAVNEGHDYSQVYLGAKVANFYIPNLPNSTTALAGWRSGSRSMILLPTTWTRFGTLCLRKAIAASGININGISLGVSVEASPYASF